MIYLDNASTTPVCDKAKEAAVAAMTCFGNPSSLHGLGLEAEKIVKKSRETIAAVLGVSPKTVYFTSGGTEANNTAVFGGANINRAKRVITSKIEHPSVLEPFARLENDGFEVVYIDVDENGVIKLDELENAITPDTGLVSIMHINNETGMIQPVDKIKPIINEKAPKALFHVDCVQSFGKAEVKPSKWGADMISISAHKINGIKGCGALYLSANTVKPLMYGGGQQNGVRPGTENVVGIAAFGAAAEKIDIPFFKERTTILRQRLRDGIINNISDVNINGSDEYSSGNILNVSFLGIKAEILLHILERQGIYVSTGSACSSNKPMPSHVLTAMGCTSEQIKGAVRFSLSTDITGQDIDTVVEVLIKEVADIRRTFRK